MKNKIEEKETEEIINQLIKGLYEVNKKFKVITEKTKTDIMISEGLSITHFKNSKTIYICYDKKGLEICIKPTNLVFCPNKSYFNIYSKENDISISFNFSDLKLNGFSVNRITDRLEYPLLSAWVN